MLKDEETRLGNSLRKELLFQFSSYKEVSLDYLHNILFEYNERDIWDELCEMEIFGLIEYFLIDNDGLPYVGEVKTFLQQVNTHSAFRATPKFLKEFVEKSQTKKDE